MSTEQPENDAPNEEREPTASEQLVDGLDEIAELLGVFTPEDTCSVLDLTGAAHTFAPVLSARRTIRAARLVKSMFDEQPDDVADEVRSIARARGRQEAMRAGLFALVDDERNEERLHDLFALCHGPRFDAELGKTVPGLLKSALKVAEEKGLEGVDGGVATNALDLFEPGAFVDAMLPFLPRIASSLAGTVRKMATRARSGMSSPQSRPPHSGK